VCDNVFGSYNLPLCYSVLTPYYTEDVLFSLPGLEEPNEDGVSILFYLQKIYPGLFMPSVFGIVVIYLKTLSAASILVDTIFWISFLHVHAIDEWTNFLERVDCKSEEELRRNEELEEELRLWASYRGQTLTRTGTSLKSWWWVSDSTDLENSCTVLVLLCTVPHTRPILIDLLMNPSNFQ